MICKALSTSLASILASSSNILFDLEIPKHYTQIYCCLAGARARCVALRVGCVEHRSARFITSGLRLNANCGDGVDLAAGMGLNSLDSFGRRWFRSLRGTDERAARLAFNHGTARRFVRIEFAGV